MKKYEETAILIYSKTHNNFSFGYYTNLYIGITTRIIHQQQQNKLKFNILFNSTRSIVYFLLYITRKK